MAEDRKNGILIGIEPDSKVKLQCYMKTKNREGYSVVISTQHSKDLNQKK